MELQLRPDPKPNLELKLGLRCPVCEKANLIQSNRADITLSVHIAVIRFYLTN